MLMYNMYDEWAFDSWLDNWSKPFWATSYSSEMNLIQAQMFATCIEWQDAIDQEEREKKKRRRLIRKWNAEMDATREDMVEHRKRVLSASENPSSKRQRLEAIALSSSADLATVTSSPLEPELSTSPNLPEELSCLQDKASSESPSPMPW